MGNLLDLTGDSGDLRGAFDLVVEIYTLQALHPSLRESAIAGIHGLMAPDATALVVQVVRPDDEPLSAEPPWTLTRAEIEAVAGDGVELESLDEVLPSGRVNPLWRLVVVRR